MSPLKSVFAFVGVLALSTSLATAAEVKVTGVHLCCGQCVKDLEAAFKESPEGVSAVKIDKDAETVTFEAADEKAAAAGVAKLAETGFGGEAKMGDKAVRFPNPGLKREDREKKVETVTFKGVHMCCPGCIEAIEGAMKEVKGVDEVAVDKEAKTVKLSGKSIGLRAAYRQLTKSGFYGKIEG